jgi:hypothetical protein
MIKYVVAPVLLSVMCANSLAAGWKAEPKKFMGVTLGEAFESPYLSCDADDSEKPCIDDDSTYSETYRLIKRIPVPYADTANVVIFNGKVAAVQIVFNKVGFESVLSMLHAKYGKPHKSGEKKKVNAFGAVFPSRFANWTGQGVIISVEEMSSSVDSGVINVMHIKTLLASQLQEVKKGAAAASGL